MSDQKPILVFSPDGDPDGRMQRGIEAAGLRMHLLQNMDTFTNSDPLAAAWVLVLNLSDADWKNHPLLVALSDKRSSLLRFACPTPVVGIIPDAGNNAEIQKCFPWLDVVSTVAECESLLASTLPGLVSESKSARLNQAGTNDLRYELSFLDTSLQDFLILLMRALPVNVSVRDLDRDEVVFSNRSILEDLGYRYGLDFASDAEFYALTWDSEEEERRHAWEAGLQHNAPGEVQDFEFRMRHRDGYWLHYEQRAMVMPKAKPDSPPMLLKITQNVTERRKLRDRLQDQQRMEALGSLARAIAHDFNNMLGPLLGNLQLMLKDTALSARSRQRLDTCISTVLRVRDLAGGILEFGIQRSGEDRECQMEHVISDTLRLVRSAISPGVTVRMELEACPVVRADPMKLQQVFLNLITNANQALREKGNTMTLRCTSRTTASGDTEVIGEVEDDGPGIPSDLQSRVFDLFFSTKKLTGGSGIGLSTSSKIVEELGGRLVLESEEGRGALFRVVLPVAPVDISQTRVIR